MIQYRVLDWSAWSPSLRDRSDWLEWGRENSLNPEALRGEATPDLEGVEPRQRRRLSRLTEMLLHVARRACDRAEVDPAGLPSVFASRHGEVETTIDLLETISRDGLISPMGFSNSVHNTASGYFGINTDNPHGSHSVSSGVDTFPQGMLDALALCRGSDSDTVLYVFGDILLPEPLDDWEADPPVEFAVGMVLGDSGGDGSAGVELGESSSGGGTARPGLMFLKKVLGGESSFVIGTDRYDWRFEMERFPGLGS
jgi:hypothetical protein